jgi:hypothetical protein
MTPPTAQDARRVGGDTANMTASWHAWESEARQLALYETRLTADSRPPNQLATETPKPTASA